MKNLKSKFTETFGETTKLEKLQLSIYLIVPIIASIAWLTFVAGCLGYLD